MLVKIVLAVIITEASRLAARVTVARNGVPGIKEHWSRLQLYTLVLLSLTLHLVLIALGYVIKNRRGKTWVAFLTSIGYFFGDLVATTALTTLLRSQLKGKQFSGLQAFWAPLLLLHLGSTETIAANLLDEKKLWRMYTLGLIIQFGMACYVVGRFLKGTDHVLAFIAIPIFAAGFLKCAERLWILNFSGFSQFKNSALSTPSKPKSRSTQSGSASLDAHLTQKSIIPEARHLHTAYLSFHMFVLLFADIRLSIYKKLSCIFSLESMLSQEEAIQQNVKAEEAFKRVDTELDFLFDVYYTKTIILDIPLGFAIRLIYFLLSTAALLAFSYARDHKHEHPQVEICITYLLLFGAFFSDGIALVSHLFSNWTLYWLTDPQHWRHLPKCFHPAIVRILDLKRSRKGVKYMAQHSLLNDCLNANANKFNAAMTKIVDPKKILKKFWNIQPHAWVDVSPTWAVVDADLKDLIICRLQVKREKYEDKKFKFSYLSCLVEKEASEVVKGAGPTIRIYDEIKWSINKVEFTHSLLLWHIATDILFHYHERRYPGSAGRRYQQISKKLSNYMMHLLVRRSFMLHSGISKLRYSDTFFEARYFIGWEMKSKNLAEVAMAIIGLDTELRATLSEIRGEGEGEGGKSVFCSGEGGKSVFFAGCKLANQLQSFVDERLDPEELWEMICYFWMEMLFSAAYDCDWKEHAHQLGQGGELLSHVALLMAHLGLSKHLKMIKEPDQGCEPPWDWDNVSQMASYFA